MNTLFGLIVSEFDSADHAMKQNIMHGLKLKLKSRWLILVQPFHMIKWLHG